MVFPLVKTIAVPSGLDDQPFGPCYHTPAWPAHAGYEYVKINDEKSGKNYIVSEKLLSKLYEEPKKVKYKVHEKLRGSEMLDWPYTRHWTTSMMRTSCRLPCVKCYPRDG